jgi:hypothetical protein
MKTTFRSAGPRRPDIQPATSRLKPALLLLLLAGASAVRAQSAAGFTAPAPPSAPAAAVSPPADSVTTPSRMVDLSRIDAYTASLASVVSMRGRELDPFGHSQDPDAKPVIKETATVARRIPRQETPFSDIVQLITVNAIMPGEGSFLVGSRTVKTGEELPLAFRGKSIRVKVTGVTARRITFQNIDSGETASRNMQLLPSGMERGARGAFSAPGMVADSANAPLELDTAAPAN